MDFDVERDAFYESRRTVTLPLAVNDVVIVKEGKIAGAQAWVISLQCVSPEPRYLIEYEDGSEEVLALGQIHYS